MENYGVEVNSTQRRGHSGAPGYWSRDVSHEKDGIQATEDAPATHDAERPWSSSQPASATTSDAAPPESGGCEESAENDNGTSEDESDGYSESPIAHPELEVKNLQSTPEECSTDGTTNSEIYDPSYQTCDTDKLRSTSCGRGDGVSPDGNVADVEAEPDARDSAAVEDYSSDSSDTIENVDIDCSESGDMGSAESYMNDSAAASSYTSDAYEEGNKDDDNADVDIECSDLDDDYGTAFGVHTGGAHPGLDCAESSDSLDCSLGYSDDFSDYFETPTPVSLGKAIRGGGSPVTDASKGGGIEASELRKSDVAGTPDLRKSDIAGASESKKCDTAPVTEVKKGGGAEATEKNPSESELAASHQVNRRTDMDAIDAGDKNHKAVYSSEHVKPAYDTIELLSVAEPAVSSTDVPSSAKVDHVENPKPPAPKVSVSQAGATLHSSENALLGSKEKLAPPNPPSVHPFWRPSPPEGARPTPNRDASTVTNSKSEETPRPQGLGQRLTNDFKKAQFISDLRRMSADGFTKSVVKVEQAPTAPAPVVAVAPPPGNNRGYDVVPESPSSITSRLVKEEVEQYVGGVEKYCMWNLNPNTGEHEFDPGPLALDFYCNACQCSLPLGTFRIRCVECVDFDLCIPCACKGAEKNEHRNTHKYIPIAPNSFAIFGDWNADAELLLLEGISKYGFGNWNQVAEMVNRRCTKNKSATECENHYNEFYIHSPFSPFPDVRRMRSPVKSQGAFQRLNGFFNLVQKAHGDEKPRTEKPLADVDENVHHVDLIPRAVNMRATVGPRLKFFQNMNGYNVYRDELEMEHNNDAETLIKDLEFEPWDTPPEIDFKLRLVEIYNSMLDDRIRHKRILIHRFWHDYPVREQAFKTMNQIERSAYWRLSPLMRLHSEEDHIKLTRLIVARIEIEKRLRLVSTWFSLGLRTFSDVQNFDIQKFPSAHAAYRNAELQPVARNLLASGFMKETTLDDFSAQLCDRLCNELCISKDHVNNVLSEVNRLNGGMPMPREPSTSVVPTWDYCFDGGRLVDRNVQRMAAPRIALNEPLDPSWHPRLVLEGNGPYALPPGDFTNIRFSPLSSSAVQQSQVIPGVKSCLYIAKLVPQLKTRVRKNVCKRKRSLLAPEPVKRGNNRR
ncbi:ADA2-A transcriptional co-activator SAGA component [Babesia ovata]|uniref:ADA2-A transcriptional co-activator SAGA component n=1 Tax=Babesia ovata TaxID=189622 RepID=A0A2H6KGL9_9APIC|nr:ADA2-A transcriptional co-activator SAGA component [Babesia ovata]GBE62136.1 ADA2-A transcriptional co-activator SAGA component [Babesia ovata]